MNKDSGRGEEISERVLSATRRKQGVLISYAYTSALVVVNLLYVPLLLSTIGRDEYGLYQTVGSIVAYIVSINSVLSAGVGRYYSMYKAEGNEVMMENTLAIAKRLYWILSLAAAVVVAIVIPVFRIAYSGSFTGSQLDECCVMLIILAVNCIVTFNNTINIAAINANERFFFLKGTQLATLVAQPVIILFVARYFPNAVTISLVVLAMNILCSMLQRVFALSYLHVSCAYHGWDRKLARGILSFSMAVVMATVADQIFWSSGKLVVGYFYGAGAVAIYSVGAQIYTAYMYAGVAVNGVFFQRVSELYHRERDNAAISELFVKVGRITFFVCSLILGCFAILGQNFISLWAGESFSDAYWIALAVMIPLTVDLVQNLGLTILQVEDRYHFRGIVYLALSTVNIGISIMVAQVFGMIAVAVSSGLCMLVGNGLVMNWYYAKRIGLDIARFWREIGRLVCLFLCIITVAGLLYGFLPEGYGAVRLLLIGAVAYIAIYAFFMGKWGLNNYERGIIRKIFHVAKFVKHN